MFSNPSIHKSVSWPSIITISLLWFIFVKKSYISYPSNINKYSVFFLRMKHFQMKSGCQWSALTTCSNISATKVTNNCQTSKFRHSVSITNLKSKWVFEIRSMSYRLTVTPNSEYILFINTCFFNNSINCLTQHISKPSICLPHSINFIISRCTQRMKVFL